MNRATAIAAVAAFGAAGSASRYIVVSVATHHLSSKFPYGTLTVNLLGCFLIGLLFVFLGKHASPSSHPIFVACGIGFLGGFTTFSSYSLDSNLLIDHRQFTRAAINVIGSVAAGLLLTRLGMQFARWFL